MSEKSSTAGILITGANGHLGQRLVPALAARRPVVAVVRSNDAQLALEQALSSLPAASAERVSIRQLSYTDEAALRVAATGCDQIIHLAGILKESPWSTYKAAHEDTTVALLNAVAGLGIKRIQYLSIVGSHPESANACLASKGRAESKLLASECPTLVLQVPMVLGEGDYAAAALNSQARKRINVVFAAGARDQPLYAGDVVAALLAGINLPSDFNSTLTLAGPEAVNKRQLITRAAGLLQQNTSVIGLPAGAAIALAKLLALFSKNPPVTVPMMEILHHDDNYDPEPACQQLGIPLTTLDDMLEHVLRSA